MKVSFVQYTDVACNRTRNVVTTIPASGIGSSLRLKSVMSYAKKTIVDHTEMACNINALVFAVQ